MSDTITLDALVGKLKEGVTTIVFEKLDGSLRVMNATLSEEILPPSDFKKGEDSIKEKKEITALPVWDMEAHGWRSFCLDRIQKVNGEKVTYAK